MKSLFTLIRHDDINWKGTTLFRKAVRAIIYKDGKVLLIKSQKYGEIKFPGGGINPGEDVFSALSREVKEETGYQIYRKTIPFGKTMEFAKDFKEEFDIFQQESKYYLCRVHPNPTETDLSDYEIEYGYQPIWMDPYEAYLHNLEVHTNDLIPWKERDTLVLQMISEMRDVLEN